MPVTIELGMQTIHDKSLLFLNRNHNHQDTLNALEMCAEYNIPTGVHLIIGIPEETESMVLETINFVNKQRNIKDKYLTKNVNNEHINIHAAMVERI